MISELAATIAGFVAVAVLAIALAMVGAYPFGAGLLCGYLCCYGASATWRKWLM